MTDHESIAHLSGRLVGHLIILGLVIAGSALIYQKYGTAEAVAFFVLAGLLSDIRSNVIRNRK